MGADPCDVARQRLGPLVDGRLEGRARRVVLLHVAGCALCQARRNELERLGRAARALPRPALDPRLAERVRRAAQPQARPTAGRVALLAAACLTLGATYLLGRTHGARGVTPSANPLPPVAPLPSPPPRPLRPGTIPLHPVGPTVVREDAPDWLPPREGPPAAPIPFPDVGDVRPAGAPTRAVPTESGIGAPPPDDGPRPPGRPDR